MMKSHSIITRLVFLLVLSQTAQAQQWTVSANGDTLRPVKVTQGIKVPFVKFNDGTIQTTAADISALGSMALTDSAYWHLWINDSLGNYVPIFRTLTAGYGINTIGDLSANRTVSADTANATATSSRTGFLSYTDWGTFNAKQPNYIARSGGTLSPVTATDSLLMSVIYGSTSSGGNLTLLSTTHATKGKIFFGANNAFDIANTRLGIGTASPSTNLEISSTSSASVKIFSNGNNAEFIGRRNNAVGSGTGLSRFVGAGLTDVGGEGTGGEVLLRGDGTWTATSLPTQLRISLVPSGSTTLQEYFTLRNSGNLGLSVTSPTARLHIKASNGQLNAFAVERSASSTAVAMIDTNGNYYAGNGSALAPAYSFTGETNTGLYLQGTGSLSITNSGAERHRFTSTGHRIINDSGFLSLGASSDVVLERDAANVLAQRNGTNAQTFRIYNTYTDASNYERAGLYWSSNIFRIESEKAGTGNWREVLITGSGVTSAIAGTGNITRVTSSGLTFPTDNTYDIGASGANRPRIVWAGTALESAGYIGLASTGSILWSTRSRMQSTADGQITLFNNAGTDFTRLNFGGTTSSFPALKRSSTAIQTRLADDSGYAPFETGTLTVNTAGGNVTWGTYSPTAGDSLNFTTALATDAQYSRVGNTVTVSGMITGTPGGAGSSVIKLTIPIASNFANVNEAAGTGTTPTIAGQGVAVLADVNNDGVLLQWIADAASVRSIYYHYTYQIK